MEVQLLNGKVTLVADNTVNVWSGRLVKENWNAPLPSRCKPVSVGATGAACVCDGIVFTLNVTDDWSNAVPRSVKLFPKDAAIRPFKLGRANVLTPFPP